jgi:hypothetical protein
MNGTLSLKHLALASGILAGAATGAITQNPDVNAILFCHEGYGCTGDAGCGSGVGDFHGCNLHCADGTWVGCLNT